VREQTAELASLALSDAASGYSSSSPPKHSSPFVTGEGAATIDSIFDKPQSQDNDSNRPSTETSHPEAIEELSEPVSPEESSEPAQSRSPGTSALTQMLRSSPPDDITYELNGSRTQGTVTEASLKPPSVAIDDSMSEDTEHTPLIQKHPSVGSHRISTYDGAHVDIEGATSSGESRWDQLGRKFKQSIHSLHTFQRVIFHPKSWDRKAIWKNGFVEPASLLPAVFLGLLLNILDALSYGMFRGRSENTFKLIAYRNDSFSPWRTSIC
jgi:SulP family sulfate permease